VGAGFREKLAEARLRAKLRQIRGAEPNEWPEQLVGFLFRLSRP
jgi:hypothetical protein